MHVLVSWIGHTDLRALAVDQSAAIKKQIAKEVRTLEPVPQGVGPVRTLTDEQPFDRIYFLSNYSENISKLFLKWLGKESEVVFCSTKLSNPSDYSEILNVVDREMQKIADSLEGERYNLSILLSPGTPAMAAIWILLGKTKYPATFYQTHEGKVSIADIPFDLVVDFVPQFLRKPDSQLQHLAARSPHEIEGFERIIGKSKIIRLAAGRARKAAVRDVPVLITGESGTGKEMFARAIHKASHRRDGPFIPINCAAIPKELIESELFGSIKGAFTGATDRDGAFKQADNGTLFLDELGECPLDVQVKLLRVLQPPDGKPPCTREFQPVGSSKTVSADVRVIAATNQDLIKMLAANQFREDLYYRLAVITIKLPSLRERRGDIPAIATKLLQQINEDFVKQEPGYSHKSLSESATLFVSRHAWPGNVRQLYNTLLQAAVMSEADEIRLEDLEIIIAEMPTIKQQPTDLLEVTLGDGFNLDEHLKAIQKNYLRRAMREANGVQAQAARLLGIEVTQTLSNQLKRLNVQWE